MKILKNVLFYFLLLFECSAYAGPFGLEMGMSIDEIDRSAKLHVLGRYSVSVPRPHSLFETYGVTVGDDGLCHIRAISSDIYTNVFGLSLESSFMDIREKIDNVYGDSDLSDILLPGSIWKDPRDWMMSLVKQERLLSAKWENSNGKNIKGDVSHIVMLAIASDVNNGHMGVDYYFSNFDSCVSDISDNDDGVL